MPTVRIAGVSKSFDGSAQVLADLDLSVADGEILFLLGPSGCGKTTLLRILAGLEKADAGTVHFGDREVTALPTESRGIGMVFQNYALWPHLDVAGNVAFALEMARVPHAERRQRVAEALAMVELAGLERRGVGELSGGQQQRVALARALVARPQVLLLDEPLSNLDPNLRADLRATIRRVCKTAGVTAVYVTHDRHEALSTADRIALMLQGRIAMVGTPRELHRRPVNAAVAGFVGEVNLVPGTLKARSGTGGTVASAIGDLSASRIPPDLAVGAALTLCLRPECLQLGMTGANLLQATILAETFLGDRSTWRLRIASMELEAHEAVAPERAIGSPVGLCIAPEHVVVLP